MGAAQGATFATMSVASASACPNWSLRLSNIIVPFLSSENESGQPFTTDYRVGRLVDHKPRIRYNILSLATACPWVASGEVRGVLVPSTPSRLA